MSIGTYYILNFITLQTKNSYLEDSNQLYQRAYNTIYEQYKELSDVIFTGLLKLTDVDTLLYRIDQKSITEQLKIRRSIYIQTIQRFNTLKAKGIVSINYILPSNKFFLKMNNPTLYKTTISEKRDLIKYVQKNKKPISGYEIGKSGAGYRFIYPLMKDNEYIGAISITFSEKAITSAIMKQYYVLSNFIISDNNFNKKFLETTENYIKTHINGFVYSKLVLESLEEASREELPKISPNHETSKIIFDRAMSKETTTFYTDDTHMIVTTIPVIHSITRNQEAFITIQRKGNKIKDLYRNHNIIFYLLIFLYATILLIFYLQTIKRIIEKENLEQLMIKDKQLFEQAKMAQMGEMIANIAHQWRQPLSSISTIASGLKLNYEYGLLKKNDIPEYMDIIVKNTQYLSKTIDTFRGFLKQENLAKEIIIQEKIDEAIEIVNATLANNHIKLIKDVPYKQPIKITTIPDALGQVIINILNNAKDALIQKKIEDKWIKLDLNLIKDSLIIYISDNAGGIDEKYINRIFEPYFTTKHQTQGTGLGLYMSTTIVEKHLNGKLWVENSKYGAKFAIKIPFKQF